MRTTEPGRSQAQPAKRLLEEAEDDPLLTPGEVAALFRVDPKTVTRWAHADLLPYVKTLGGHRRFRESDVRKLLQTVKDAA